MSKAASRSVGEGVPSEPVLRQIRIPFIQKVTLELGTAREDVFAVDLGLRGIFVERQETLPPGVRLEIRFRLPGNEIPVAARCRVAWAHLPGEALVSKRLPIGMGLEFVEASDWDRARLREHLVEYLRRNPRNRRFERQWPEAGPEEEDDP